MEKSISKKGIVAIGAVLMAVALLVPAVAFASTLTITNTLAGKTYDAYLFFSTDANGDYVFDDNSGFKTGFDTFRGNHPDAFTLTDIDATHHRVVANPSFDENLAAELASTMMGSYDSWKNKQIAEKTATSDSVVFDGIPDGYYLVHSSAGTVLSMVTVNGTGTINEKNTEDRWCTLMFSIIKDAVGYYEKTNVKTEIKFNENYVGDEKTLVVTNDYTENGVAKLRNPQDFNLVYGQTNDGEEPNATVPPSWYSLESTDYGWVVTFNENANFPAGYSLVINNTAYGMPGLDIYSSSTGQEVEHTCIAHALDLKVSSTEDVGTDSDVFRVLGVSLVKLPDGSNAILAGAKFKLYSSQTGNDPIYFMRTGNNYTVAQDGAAGAVTELEVGYSYISGLGSQKYWFEETQAPEGYNMLTSRVSKELSNDSDFATITKVDNVDTYVEGGLAVINRTGIIIPGTGGLGTIIFTLLGAGVIISAICYRVMKRRKLSGITDLTA